MSLRVLVLVHWPRWRRAAATSGCRPRPGRRRPRRHACAAGPPVTGIPALTARLVVSGLRSPLDLQSVPSDAERLYVVEQGGRIRVVRSGQLQAAAFLDVSSRISSGGERGLLGLAFHPQFATNRRFYVNYTNPAGDTHIAEFRATSADAADPGSERVLLVVSQPFANHNGGGLAFDNSGRLLIALGDGGSGGDPQNNGQRLDTLLGKIAAHRRGRGSAVRAPRRQPVPDDGRGARGDLGLWPAQPVQDRDRPADGRPLHRRRGPEPDRGDRRRPRARGAAARTTAGGPPRARSASTPRAAATARGLTPPVYEYTHAEGCSVTGGVVYRGCRVPALAGTYFFGDYCSGLVRSFRLASGMATELRDWTSRHARDRRTDLVRPRCCRRGVHRRLRRRSLPARAGELS